MANFKNLQLQIEYQQPSLRVYSREIASREFKEKFEVKEIADYLRTMAAMANDDGGIIIFGVTDKPRIITGVDVDFINDASLSDQIKQNFEPYIHFEIIDTEEIEHKKVYAIKVSSCNQKPIICKKTKTLIRKRGNKDIDETVLEEGAIYFRYGPQTSKIKFNDLQEILKERQKSELNSILQNLEIMQKIGVQNVGIINANTNDEKQKISALYVSEETAKKLNLIQKGKIVEDNSTGSAAYYIVGEVELRTGIEVPIPEPDRILPSEARKKLSPTFKNNFPDFFTGEKQLTTTHLKRISCRYKIRDKENKGTHNTKYCYYDAKTQRFFYRNAFIKFIDDKIKQNKGEILSFI